MSLIFESVSSLSKYLLVFLKLLKFEVFYLRILNKSETKKNEIANYLKKANILPLPIEKEKKHHRNQTAIEIFKTLNPIRNWSKKKHPDTAREISKTRSVYGVPVTCP